jgi:hypothetical protein
MRQTVKLMMVFSTSSLFGKLRTWKEIVTAWLNGYQRLRPLFTELWSSLPYHRGNVSRIRLALIALAMEHGGHIDMPGAEFIECTAYRLEPITTGSFNDLDGEVIEPGPVQAAVIPHAIRAFCNP